MRLCPLAPDTRERFSDVRFNAAGVMERLRVEDAVRGRGAHKQFVHGVASRAIGNLWMFELESNAPVRVSGHRNVRVRSNFREASRAFAPRGVGRHTDARRSIAEDLRATTKSRYVMRIFGCTSAFILSAAHSSAARAVP